MNYIYMYVIHVHSCNTSSIFISVRRIKKNISNVVNGKSKRGERKAYEFLPLFIRQKDVVTYVLERKDLLVPFLNPTTFIKIL